MYFGCLTLVWAYVSLLHCITALAILIVIIWLNNTRNTTHGKIIAYGYVRTEVKTLNALLNPVLMESIVLFFSTEFWGSFSVKLISICALKIIYNCQLHDFILHCNCEMYHLQDTTSIQPFSLSTSSTNFCTRCFLCNCLKHCWCQNQKAVICPCSVLHNMQCCVS